MLVAERFYIGYNKINLMYTFFLPRKRVVYGEAKQKTAAEFAGSI